MLWLRRFLHVRGVQHLSFFFQDSRIPSWAWFRVDRRFLLSDLCTAMHSTTAW